MTTGIDLVSLGWDDSFASAFAAQAPAGAVAARVVAQHRGRYIVAGEHGEHDAVVAGRARHEALRPEDFPAVGDWVIVTPGEGGGRGVIADTLPRRSAFRRKVAGDVTAAQVVAANVDVAFVVTALPLDLNLRRLERYLTLAWESGAVPVVVITKTDLTDDLPAALAAVGGVAPGTDVVALSALTGAGVAALAAHLRPSRTAVLLGSSGAGKSTLVNRMLGEERLRTAAVRDDGRGRHTTTHRELFRLPGGALLIDTPGMRELQLWTADTGLEAAFGDVQELAQGCRFRDCRHDSEPGCAVRAAVEAGRLAADRLESWHSLRRELAYLERKQNKAAEAEYEARNRAVMRAARSWIREKRGD